MSKINFRALLILLSLLLTTPSLRAQVPRLLNYQGKLLMKNAAAEGIFSVTFTIYSDSTGDSVLWRESHQRVEVAHGVFNVLLGSVNPFPANLFTTAGDRYLGIVIGNDAEMKPRLRMTSVAFAINASHVDTAKSGSTGTDNDWVVADNNMYAAVTGNVGIGTTTPSQQLVVGDDLGFEIPGNRITVGNRNSHSAINLGEDMDNRAVVAWRDGNNFLRLFTINNRRSYLEQNLVLKDGKVGLGTMTPTAVLDIASNGDPNIPNILSRNSAMDFVIPVGQVIQFGTYDLARKIFAERMFVGRNIGIGTNRVRGRIGVADLTITDKPILAVHRHPKAPNNFVEGNEGYHDAVDAPTRKFHIDRNGTFMAGSDFAEVLPAKNGEIGCEPGEVLVLSAEPPLSVEKCDRVYDPKVVGVYSVRPAVLGADKNGETEVGLNEIPIAIVGIALAKASAHNGAIVPGDWLTTSEMAGHAMKAKPVAVNGVSIYPAGTILGRAMEPLLEGVGTIKVFLMPQ